MRIDKFDTIKAIAMANVVLVHAFAGKFFPNPAQFRRCFVAGVLGASMFLFSFISGWVIKPGRWNWNKIFRLSCVVVAANFLVNAVQDASGCKPFHGYAAVAVSFWYMAVLLACKIALPAFRRPAAALCVSVLASWSSFLLPGCFRFSPFDRFLGFAPFFALGYFIGNDKSAARIADWLKEDSRHPWRYGTALVLSILVLVLSRFTPLSPAVGMAINNARRFVGASWETGALRIASHLWFGLCVVLWLKAVPNREIAITRYGRRTLPVYLFHMVPVFLCAGFVNAHPRCFEWRHAAMALSVVATMLLFHRGIGDLFSFLVNGPHRAENSRAA